MALLVWTYKKLNFFYLPIAYSLTCLFDFASIILENSTLCDKYSKLCTVTKFNNENDRTVSPFIVELFCIVKWQIPGTKPSTKFFLIIFFWVLWAPPLTNKHNLPSFLLSHCNFVPIKRCVPIFKTVCAILFFVLAALLHKLEKFSLWIFPQELVKYEHVHELQTIIQWISNCFSIYLILFRVLWQNCTIKLRGAGTLNGFEVVILLKSILHWNHITCIS